MRIAHAPELGYHPRMNDQSQIETARNEVLQARVHLARGWIDYADQTLAEAQARLDRLRGFSDEAIATTEHVIEATLKRVRTEDAPAEGNDSTAV